MGQSAALGVLARTASPRASRASRAVVGQPVVLGGLARTGIEFPSRAKRLSSSWRHLGHHRHRALRVDLCVSRADTSCVDCIKPLLCNMQLQDLNNTMKPIWRSGRVLRTTRTSGTRDVRNASATNIQTVGYHARAQNQYSTNPLKQCMNALNLPEPYMLGCS